MVATMVATMATIMYADVYTICLQKVVVHHHDHNDMVVIVGILYPSYSLWIIYCYHGSKMGKEVQSIHIIMYFH